MKTLADFDLRKFHGLKIGDFQSSIPCMKNLGMKMEWKCSEYELREMGDRRGWFYDIKTHLDGLKRDGYYAGWAQGLIYGQVYIFIYAKKRRK